MNIKQDQILAIIKKLLNKSGILVAMAEGRDGFIIGTEEFVMSELDQTYAGKFDVYITGEEESWPKDPNSLN